MFETDDRQRIAPPGTAFGFTKTLHRIAHLARASASLFGRSLSLHGSRSQPKHRFQDFCSLVVINCIVLEVFMVRFAFGAIRIQGSGCK